LECAAMRRLKYRRNNVGIYIDIFVFGWIGICSGKMVLKSSRF
jgi:hypothetical protein